MLGPTQSFKSLINALHKALCSNKEDKFRGNRLSLCVVILIQTTPLTKIQAIIGLQSLLHHKHIYFLEKFKKLHSTQIFINNHGLAVMF